MNSTRLNFDYEKKIWGSAPVKNLYTNFQGFALKIFCEDVLILLKSKKISMLDSGCGAGNIPHFIKSMFPEWKVYGVDISQESLELAKKRFKKIRFIKSSAENIPLADKSIDIITSFDSLEHYHNLDKTLDEAKRVLSDDGIFYVVIPLEKQFPTLYWVLYKLGWRGKMRHSGHINYFTANEISKKIEKHSFKLIKKKYSSHILFSIADVGYYFIQSIFSNEQLSFESKVHELDPGFRKMLLTIIKKTISALSYIESSLFFWFPGGKGHFIFIKKNDDFFSVNPPLTVVEGYQMKSGLKKVIQPRDIEIKKDLSEMNFSDANDILDFGSASGIWLERLLNETKGEGIGVDISEKLISIANQRKNKKGKYYNNCKSWPIDKNSIDFCYSFDTFEHIKKYQQELITLYDTLKKGGKFYFYTLNPNNKYTIDWLIEKLGSNYMYKRADHEKEMFIKPEKLKKDLEKTGFKNVSFKLYDGPCNLLWRVYSYGYLSIMNRICNFLQINSIMDKVISINDAILRFVYPLNQAIDGVFIKRGYSNGYFVWGEK